MNSFSLVAFLFISSIAVSLTSPADLPAAEKPNIIFIMADDLGYGELGCYGQKIIRTPNIDRLAAEGIRFTQHYSGQAVCAPARCVLMTGKHTGHSYIRNNGDPKNPDAELKKKYGWEFPGQNPIPDAEVTIAEILKQLGYATGCTGKWGLGHFGTTGAPNRQGFDLFYGFNCQRHAHNHYPGFLWRNENKEPLPGNDRSLHGQTYSQDKFTEVALQFIRDNKDGPFFLYVPFAVPHLAIQVPDESLKEYRDKISEEPYEHKSAYQKHPTPRAGYAAMVTHMDRDVGRISALVRELGIDDNTIIFFTSDNGPAYSRLGGADSGFFNSTAGLRARKGSLYEGGIRVPMIARWPGKIFPNQTSDHISAFWDILPTVCDLVDARPPADIDGISLQPTLMGVPDAQREHDIMYWEFAAYGGQQALRMGKWKGIRQNMLRKNNKDPLKIELYDLEADPSESTDLAAGHPQIVERIDAAMRSNRVPSKLFPMRPID